MTQLMVVPSPVLSPTIVSQIPDDFTPPQEEWRGQNQGFSREGYEYCPILPWYNEIVTRMHESAAAGQAVVNLSYTHPRGYIPNQIIRRPQVRAALQGWQVITGKTAPTLPPDRWFLPRGAKDLEFCDLDIFLKEIDRREQEAKAEAFGQSQLDAKLHVPAADLSSWHPLGGIPPVIMKRLERRKSPQWREEVRSEIDKLLGDANKSESFANTQDERATAMTDQGKDPTALRAAANDLRERAAVARQNAQWLKKEIGDAKSP
jgi:hypothetical protein